MGNYEMASNVKYYKADEFRAAAIQNYTVDGKAYGEYKTAGNFGWLKVWGAGHEVPFYREFSPSRHKRFNRHETDRTITEPEVALQAFIQTMQKKAITST